VLEELKVVVGVRRGKGDGEVGISRELGNCCSEEFGDKGARLEACGDVGYCPERARRCGFPVNYARLERDGQLKT